MKEKINCPIKFNLILKVLSKNTVSFHEIFTFFWKKTAAEVLTISPITEGNAEDIIAMPGVSIRGVNLVAETIAMARKKTVGIPPLKVTIDKVYPPGSGIGAGSGNAAAMITWLRENYGFRPGAAEISKLGADVSFLSSPYKTALAGGIGDILTPLEDIPDYFAVAAFPHWSSETRAAYEKLDALREGEGHKIFTAEECEAEALSIHSTLLRRERIGLLPNDFLRIFAPRQLTKYQEAFEVSDHNGALAWGLCGSGSAMFAIFGNESQAESTEKIFEQMSWVKKTAKLE